MNRTKTHNTKSSPVLVVDDNDMNATQLYGTVVEDDWDQATQAPQSDLDEEKTNQSEYTLELFGDEEYISVCADQKYITKPWHPNEPYIMGRMLFPNLSNDIKAYISRQQLKIECHNTGNKKEIWITDLSSFGTSLNGLVLGSNNRQRLTSNDRIGLIVLKGKVALGFVYSNIHDEPYLIKSGLSKSTLDSDSSDENSDPEDNILLQQKKTIPENFPPKIEFVQTVITRRFKFQEFPIRIH